MVPRNEFVNRERDLVVTGLPRSGTSLLSRHISESPNAYCVNEVFYNVDRLPTSLARVRQCLVTGCPVPNKYAKSGGLSTNTIRDTARVKYRRIPDAYDRDAVVASKVNIPYLNRLLDFLDHEYSVVAVIRDPIFTIASWNSPSAQSIPESSVTPEDLHPRWRGFDFPTEDRIERQSAIWVHYASLICKHAGERRVSIASYERLVRGGIVLTSIIPDWELRVRPVDNLNVKSRYPDAPFDRIESAVGESAVLEVFETLLGLENTQ